MIEGHGITVIRTNPDAADFNTNRLINQIYMHIIKSTKKQTEKSTKISLIDDLLKIFLELEIKPNLSIKSKCSRWTAKRKYVQYKTWKKAQFRIKPTKTLEQLIV